MRLGADRERERTQSGLLPFPHHVAQPLNDPAALHRAPLPRDRRVRVAYEHAPSLESSFPPSPYSSASSQSSIGSPRSRESMTIGALLTPAHEKDIDMDDRRLSAERTVPRGASPRLARRERENTLSHRA